MTDRGPWTSTASGGRFYPLNPIQDEVDIFDIAHALSNQCRFAGHVIHHYSVAQHSVLVSQLAPKGFELEGLMHDAAEAYVVDVPYPIKPHIPQHGVIEENVLKVIGEKYSFPHVMSEEINFLDRSIVKDEAIQLLRADVDEWGSPFEPLGIEIEEWTPRQARDAFIKRFYELMDIRNAA